MAVVRPTTSRNVRCQSRANRWIELADRALAERADRMIECAHALHSSIGEPLCERALPLVEVARGGAKDPVGVRVLLEDPQQHLVRNAARGRDRHQRRPRMYWA